MLENRFIKILQQADEKKIGVGAINIFNYITADAAVNAAEEIGVNLIIQTSAGTVEHYGAIKLYNMINDIRKGRNIEVALHLDHCRDMELGKLCVDVGWDSIMMDFSHLPFEENVSATREMAIYAHERGVAIEGEIGVVAGVEEDIVADEAINANYEETIQFIERTEIDAIAPAIGTAHGVYKGVPELNFTLVEQLGKGNTPVVIHGGTGLSADVFRKLIELGGRKINISTLVKNAYMKKIMQLVKNENINSPISFDKEVSKAVSEAIRGHLEVFSGMKHDFGV